MLKELLISALLVQVLVALKCNTEPEDDLKDINFINRIWIVAGALEVIIKLCIFLPVMLWGIFWNIVLVYIVCKNKHLRNSANMLIANMAVADLLTLVTHPVVFLIYDLFQNYQLGWFGCKFEGALECALLVTSVASLVGISYDRLAAIVLPEESRITKRGAKIIMVLTWVFGVCVSTPFVYFRCYKERQWLNFLEKYCTEDTGSATIYWYIVLTILVWVPIAVMLICYTSIFVKINRYEKNMKDIGRTVTRVTYRAKVAKTMFIVMMTFMVCHVPFTGLIIYRNYLLSSNAIQKNNVVQNQVNGAYRILWFSSKYMIFLNAALNPVIYGLTNEKFQHVIRNTPIVKSLLYTSERPVPAQNKSKGCRAPKKEVKIVEDNNKIFSI